jgi:hypothetical protein
MPYKSREEKSAYQREYYQKNKEKAKTASKRRREANREEAIAYAKEYYQENKENLKTQAKEYRKTHKEQVKQWRKEFRLNPWNKIHHNVSNLIRITIQRNGSSKNGNSIIQHLSYTIAELKVHLESQFESWMTWDNWSKYDPKTWDNNNSTTWTWQLDHIIPQSLLPYTSMTEDNFKKCWTLDNLRPYSAKLNSIEGANRSRHT